MTISEILRGELTRTPIALCALILFGCSRDTTPAPDSMRAASSVTPAPESTRPDSAGVAKGPAKPVCPHTGKWAQCSIERRLRQSGFVVKRIDGESPNRAGFSVKPIVYTLGASRLEVFLYDDSMDVARDVKGIDTVLVAPRGSTAMWDVPPLFIRSGNLAAVLLTQNQRQAERAVLAITAGAPQPGSSR